MSELQIAPYPLQPPNCTEYDPLATEVAERIAERLITASSQVRVEHIGSTAIPGCAGKGIVDLMVIYPAGELEAAKEALQSLGFQQQTVGHLHPETRPMRVAALEHQGQTFRIHAHVIAAGSPEVAALRTFRDRLRSDPKLVAAYVERKKAILAAGTSDCRVYSQMKGAFILDVLGSSGLPGDRKDQPANSAPPSPDYNSLVSALA